MRKKKEIESAPIMEVEQLQKDYIKELNNNLEFSLVVDPEDKYNMDALQKLFIEYYCQFKNVNTAAELANIDMNTAKSYFIAYSTQEEIRRINKAMYHKQFANKLMTVDQIGGYLTSLLTDDVPYADRLKTNEKLKVAQMIIDLNKLKAEAMMNPDELMNRDLESQLKNLSVKTISSMLDISNKEENKDELVNNFGNNLSAEEKEYLKTLSTEELLQIINSSNKGDVND